MRSVPLKPPPSPPRPQINLPASPLRIRTPIIPPRQLHRPLLIQMAMHIKAIPQQMRLMPPPLPKTLKLRLLKIILQNRLILRVRALVNNDPRSLPRTQAAHVCEPLLGDDDVEVVLSLVDVCAHGDDAGDACGVGFGRAGGRRVHDGVLCGAEEVCGAAEAIQHAGAHDAGGICVGVDVDFDGRVHSNNTQPSNNFGAVGHLLAAQEQLGRVAVPVFVEALEAVGGEADRGRGGEVEVARVEEVEEGVLEHFGPDFEVFEVCAAGLSNSLLSASRSIWKSDKEDGCTYGKSSNNGIGNVSNARLERKQVLRQAAVADFMLQKFDEVARNSTRGVILWCIWLRLIWVITLDNSHHALGIDWDMRSTDAVLGRHDEIWLAARWQVSHGDVVESFERRCCGVYFDDDLVGHLDKLWGGADTGSGNDASIFCNG